MERLLDLIFDRRFPWFFPWFVWRSLSTPRKNFRDLPAKIAVTFDVEEDYPSKKTETAPVFLERVKPILRRHEVKATFFVQGEMIDLLAKQLKELVRDGHEIGVHGFRHNNWGDAVWFWNETPLTISQKEDDLMKVRKLFRHYKIPDPVSFRAPNMNINKETFRLLDEYHYGIDSSRSSFRTSGDRYFQWGKYAIKEIPISSLPVPKIIFRHGVPIYDYVPFNLYNYLLGSLLDARDYDSPFLVFLAHPWEFFPNIRFTYCSGHNWDEFEKLLQFFGDQRTRFVTMAQLVTIVKSGDD